MPRSKNGSNESLEQNLESEDTSSLCSERSSSCMSLLDEPIKEDIADLLDGLLEKRTATRELSLKKLKRILGASLLSEELENQVETIQDLLLKCLKKSKSTTETILAAQVLILVYVTLGMEHELRLKELRDFLNEKLRTVTSEPIVQVLFYLFAVGHFISQEETDSFFEEHLLKHSSAFLAYGALSTIASQGPNEKVLQLHLKGLGLGTTFKLIAAENLALFEEQVGLPPVFKSKVLDALQGEESTSVKQIAQEDRKLIKATLPSILASLVTDEPPPEEKLQFGKQLLILDTWKKQVQFELFRQSLGSALQFHVLHNSFLHTVFGLDGDGLRAISSSSLNKQEKKLYFSPSSELNKKRTVELSKQRKQKSNKANTQLWT